MRNLLRPTLFALALAAGPALPAYGDAAAEDQGSTPEQIAARRLGLLAALHENIARAQRLVAECERRAFPEAGPARRALDGVLAKYSARMADIDQAVRSPEAAAARERLAASLREEDRLDRGRTAAAMRARCRDALAATRQLDESLEGGFDALHVLSFAAPAPEPEPDSAELREKRIGVGFAYWTGIENTVAECERRGFAEADPLRRALDAARTRYAVQWQDAKRAFEANPRREELGEKLRLKQEQDRAQTREAMQEKCRRQAGSAGELDGLARTLLGGESAAAVAGTPPAKP